MEKKTIGEWIAEDLQENEYSLKKFCTKNKLNYESTKNVYFGRVDKPTKANLKAIAKALGKTEAELSGKESSDEEKMLFNYRLCSPHGKRLVELVALVHAVVAEDERNSEKIRIPYYEPISHLDDGIEEATCKLEYLETSNQKADFGYMIKTNNFMGENLLDGDIILVQKRMPKFGEKAVFRNGKYAYFRKLEHSDDRRYLYKLKAMNPQGKDFYVNELDNAKKKFVCLGTYIGTYDGD